MCSFPGEGHTSNYPYTTISNIYDIFLTNAGSRGGKGQNNSLFFAATLTNFRAVLSLAEVSAAM